MRSPPPDRVFRLAGVLAAVWITAPEILGTILRGPSGLLGDSYATVGATVATASFAAALVFQIGSTTVFAAMFWLVTEQTPSRGRAWRRIVAIGLQTVIAIVGNGRLILLAAELPLALAPKLALRWLAGQLGLFLLVVGVLVASGLLPDADGSELVLVLGPFTGWQVVGFALGNLAARERRQRRRLGRVNAELVATRLLLAEASRSAERARLARELHDGLGHGLAALGVSLDLAERTARARVLETVVAVHAEARDLYREVRQVVSALRSERGLELGRAIRTLLAGAGGRQVRIEVPDELAVDEPSAAHAVFACVRQLARELAATEESVPENLRLAVTRGPGELRLTVRGEGTTERQRAGVLEAMRRAAAEVGARVESRADEGGSTLCLPAPVVRAEA